MTPKPPIYSMPNAVRAAILSGNTLADIMLCKWAETYRCEPSAIQQAWEAEMSSRSQEPSNAYDVEGK